MVERLSRLQHIYSHHPIYFITACTAARRELLASPAIHDAFRQFGKKGAESGALIGDYVLMPDHVHLFVSIDARQRCLSAWIKALKGSMSAELKRSGHAPPFWQKGFFDHILRSGDSYSAKWEYVRSNPIRGGLVAQCKEWPYAGRIFDLEFRRDN
jgi:putative transposase